MCPARPIGVGVSVSEVRDIVREELQPIEERLGGIEETLKWLQENVFTKPNPRPVIK